MYIGDPHSVAAIMLLWRYRAKPKSAGKRGAEVVTGQSGRRLLSPISHAAIVWLRRLRGVEGQTMATTAHVWQRWETEGKRLCEIWQVGAKNINSTERCLECKDAQTATSQNLRGQLQVEWSSIEFKHFMTILFYFPPLTYFDADAADVGLLAASVRQQDVLRLQVAVDDSFAVEDAHGRSYLLEEDSQRVLPQRPLGCRRRHKVFWK